MPCEIFVEILVAVGIFFCSPPSESEIDFFENFLKSLLLCQVREALRIQPKGDRTICLFFEKLLPQTQHYTHSNSVFLLTTLHRPKKPNMLLSTTWFSYS